MTLDDTLYDRLKFIPPPRPKTAIHPSRLKFYDSRGWLAQAKYNGTYNIVTVSPERELFAMGRTGKRHKAWQFSKASGAAFKSIPGRGWWQFCCELLDSKTPRLKNINFIHDILVADSHYTFGKSFAERHMILRNLFTIEDESEMGYYIVNENTWIATTFPGHFQDLYHRFTETDEIEGLVLRLAATPLSRSNTSSGMVKCRRPTKNYGF